MSNFVDINICLSWEEFYDQENLTRHLPTIMLPDDMFSPVSIEHVLQHFYANVNGRRVHRTLTRRFINNTDGCVKLKILPYAKNFYVEKNIVENSPIYVESHSEGVIDCFFIVSGQMRKRCCFENVSYTPYVVKFKMIFYKCRNVWRFKSSNFENFITSQPNKILYLCDGKILNSADNVREFHKWETCVERISSSQETWTRISNFK